MGAISPFCLTEKMFRNFIHNHIFLDESFSKELLKVAFDVKENGKMADSGNELLRICIWYFLSSNLTRAPVEFINAIGEYLMSSKNLAFVGKCIGIYDLIAADVSDLMIFYNHNISY